MPSYRQYTQCVAPANYGGQAAAPVIIAAAVAVLPLLGSLLLGMSLAPGVAILVLTPIIAFCRWWLYGRLICLGQDVCAVGAVLSVEAAQDKSLINPPFDRFDTDYS